MITKVIQSHDLRATLDYVYQEGKAPEVVAGSCLDTSRDGAYADIKEVINQRAEISKPVFHAVLSVPEDDVISDNIWEDIAEEYMEKMGYRDVPYVAVRHQDTDHQHIHIVASRVDRNATLISDSFEAYRSQEVARTLERKHELTRVPSSWEVDQRRARPEELHKTMRLNETNQREFMQRAIAESLKASRNTEQFVQALHTHDVRVIPNVTQDEKKVQGISFEREGVKLAGSKINRQYSWNQLKHRLDFAHRRDLETLRRPPESRTPQASKTPSPHISTTPSRPSPEKLQTPRVNASQASYQSPHIPSSHHKTPAPLLSSTHARVPEVRTPLLDESTRIQHALERAPEDRGWKAWTDALKRDGVEAVPKVTQQNHRQVRGMYFVSGETMLPGSKVDRTYSFGQLEHRLGTYDPVRDAKAFERVMVPGHGLTTPQMPRQEMAPSPSPRMPSSTLHHTMEAYRTKGWQVDVNPDTFKGTWHKEVHDSQGTSYGVIRQDQPPTQALSQAGRVAFVRMGHDTHMLHAHMEEDRLTPQRRFDSVRELEQGQDVVWKQEHGQRALIHIDSTPHPTSQDLTPEKQDEQALVQRFERGGYEVELNPSSYRGAWVREIRSDQGQRYGVMTPEMSSESPSTPSRMALIKLDSTTRLIDAKLEQGQVRPQGTLKHTDDIQKGASVLWRHSERQSALIRLEHETRSYVDTQEKERTPSAHNTSAPHPPLMSQAQWLAKTHQQGQDVRLLEPRDNVTGRLHPQPLQLQEGRYHVLETRAGRLRLIPHEDRLDTFKGERVTVRMRQDRSLDIKPMSRTKERDIDI